MQWKIVVDICEAFSSFAFSGMSKDYTRIEFCALKLIVSFCSLPLHKQPACCTIVLTAWIMMYKIY